eukprot:5816441-Prymnesium_polylepis.2
MIRNPGKRLCAFFAAPAVVAKDGVHSAAAAEEHWRLALRSKGRAGRPIAVPTVLAKTLHAHEVVLAAHDEVCRGIIINEHTHVTTLALAARGGVYGPVLEQPRASWRGARRQPKRKLQVHVQFARRRKEGNARLVESNKDRTRLVAPVDEVKGGVDAHAIVLRPGIHVVAHAVTLDSCLAHTQPVAEEPVASGVVLEHRSLMSVHRTATVVVSRAVVGDRPASVEAGYSAQRRASDPSGGCHNISVIHIHTVPWRPYCGIFRGNVLILPDTQEGT